ncbi:hypothetical protein F5141DRAFT_1225262 [Pisolithus sp. B1]|nr:hypothetical protein F5141DRAFT_1225262 [Pisolithus sp. B1]
MATRGHESHLYPPHATIGIVLLQFRATLLAPDAGLDSKSQVVEDDSSADKIQDSSPNGDQPIYNGRRGLLFSPRCLNVALIVFLVINAFCLFATMRQLSLAAQAIKPLLESRAFMDTQDLARPDPYYGL